VDYEKELKDLNDSIKSEQKKQSEAIEAMKKDLKAENVALVEKYDASQKTIEKLSVQADTLATQLKDQKMGGKRENPFKELCDAFTVKKDETKARMKKGEPLTFELKASTIDEATELSNGTTDLSSAVIVPFREQGVGKAPDRPLTLLDIVSRGTINSNRVSWVERSARTAAAAAVAEGNQYAQSDFTYIQKFAPVEKIGTFVKVTNEALEDWDQLLSEINGELFPMIERTVESAVYSGTGTSPAMQGLFDGTSIAAAYSATGISGIVTPNLVDVITACAAQIRALYYVDELTAMVNPFDYAMMTMPKNADGIYLMPPNLAPDRVTVAGCRVVPSGLVTAGEIAFGAFKRDTLFISRGITIKIWDQDSTDPEFDLKTITASVRAVNRIKTPDYNAFVYDAISDIVTAIS
jgi:HK97 family phage major capsid protein